MTRAEQFIIWLDSTARYITKKHPAKSAEMYRFVMGYSDCNALLDTEFYWELVDNGVITDQGHEFHIRGIPVLLSLVDVTPQLTKKDAEFMYVPEEKDNDNR